MNKTIFKFAVLLSFSLAAGLVSADVIKTATVGKIPHLAWAPLFFNKVSVSSPDAPEIAEALTASFKKSGYKIDENPDTPMFVIIRDFQGKAADFVPPDVRSEAKSGGGSWGAALFSLGLNVLIGQKMGVINTSDLLHSNANAVASTLQNASLAYSQNGHNSNPDQNEERAQVTENPREDANLVMFRICEKAGCAYALSYGEADFNQLEKACYKEGILDLIGQKD